MASSNRHWPSMFKSKPAHHQWQHDMNSSLLSATGAHRTPYAPGCEERTPEPKPRWNPRPEQIRILEAIFNSGMVNPPRDEIKKIRAQLQEYGQVGDANVFYWFQNRKSRSKHKQRQLLHQTAANKSQPQQTTTNNTPSPPPPPVTATATATQTQPANKAAFVTAPSFSSSSSDQSSFHSTSNKEKNQLLSVGSTTVMDLLNSPTASVNQQQPFFQGAASTDQFLNEPFFFPHVQQKNNEGSPATAASLNQGFCFPDVVSTVADDHRAVGSCSNFLFSELMLMNSFPSKKVDEEDESMKLEQQLSHYGVTTTTVLPSCVDTPILSVPSPISHILHGETNTGPTDKSTVFINDVCFEVGFGPFNVREAFGYDAMLIQSTGQPVLTNEWGVTFQPLQNGAFYYLVRTPFAPNSNNIFANDRTIDLI